MHAGGKLLTPLPMPSSGYSVPYFRDESVLKHAVAYVRPLQKNMQIDHSASSAHCEEERESKAAKVSCVNCGKEVTIGCLENHQKVCNVDVDNLSISEVRTNLTLNQTLELLTWRYCMNLSCWFHVFCHLYCYLGITNTQNIKIYTKWIL
ncbi:uncharacterized protein LOC144432625 [Glandiceps talaboti]